MGFSEKISLYVSKKLTHLVFPKDQYKGTNEDPNLTHSDVGFSIRSFSPSRTKECIEYASKTAGVPYEVTREYLCDHERESGIETFLCAVDMAAHPNDQPIKVTERKIKYVTKRILREMGHLSKKQ